MKKYFTNIITALVLVTGITLASGLVVSAAPVNVFDGNPACQTNSGSAICGNQSGDGLFGVLKNVINVLLVIGGIVSVIMIIVGGINFAVSNGDQAKIKKGRDTVLYSVIGLVVSLLAFAIVNFVIDRL